MGVDRNGGDESVGRRAFLARGAAAFAGLAAIGAGETEPERQPPPTRVLDDPAIQHGSVQFPRGEGLIDGYLARPKAEGRFPAVLVVAGNRITEEYIPNTCAALALAGYVGLAPNIFHTVPDSARTPDEIGRSLADRTEEEFLGDVRAGAAHLTSLPFTKQGGMGILGFCSGGRRALLYAVRYKEIAAVVAYHPGLTKAEEVAGLRAPVQVHQGTADRHVSVASIRELEKAFRAQATPVEIFLYEGADHGFLAYTRPYYRPDDARLSWTRTVAFLKRHLQA